MYENLYSFCSEVLLEKFLSYIVCDFIYQVARIISTVPQKFTFWKLHSFGLSLGSTITIIFVGWGEKMERIKQHRQTHITFITYYRDTHTRSGG